MITIRELSMKVIVTGASGLLGADIVKSFERAGHQVTGLMGRKVLDVTNAGAVRSFILDTSPDLVVHSAGFRMVDAAEKDPTDTYAINTLSSKNMALGCQCLNIPIIYISSDSVFDGESQHPYSEFDRTNPVNVYGYSKLLAEAEVRTHCRKHFLIRVPLLFGAFGYPESNYIHMMAQQLKQGVRMEYTTDQLCSPTYTKDVGDTLVKMAESEYYGLYHVANKGEASRYSFYKYCAEKLGLDASLLQPILQQEKPARRPKNTLLTGVAFNRTFPELDLRDWHEAIEECIPELRAAIA